MKIPFFTLTVLILALNVVSAAEAKLISAQNESVIVAEEDLSAYASPPKIFDTRVERTEAVLNLCIQAKAQLPHDSNVQQDCSSLTTSGYFQAMKTAETVWFSIRDGFDQYAVNATSNRLSELLNLRDAARDTYFVLISPPN